MFFGGKSIDIELMKYKLKTCDCAPRIVHSMMKGWWLAETEICKNYCFERNEKTETNLKGICAGRSVGNSLNVLAKAFFQLSIAITDPFKLCKVAAKDLRAIGEILFSK